MSKDNGGAAFPVLPPQDTAAGIATGYPFPESGMSLRDYFAAKAMQGYIVGTEEPDCDHIANVAYEMADAMLKARGETH